MVGVYHIVSESTHAKLVEKTEMSDEALVLAAREGNARAFEQLVQRYFGLVYTLGYARLRDHEVAQDLAQEVFLRLFLGLKDLREPRYFGTWVSRLARNLASDWSRNRQRASRLITMLPMEESGVEEKPCPVQDARERLAAEDEMRQLRAAILDLPLEQREILLLHYECGMTQQDIAARLEIHHTTVGRHLQRALNRLRRWAGVLECMETDIKRGTPLNADEKRALARSVAVVSAAAALSAEARASLASAASDSLSKLAAAAHVPAPAHSGMLAPITSVTSKATSVAMKGTMMTAKTKSGLVALTAVAAMGAGYHATHPGELKQLLRGTTTTVERKSAAPSKSGALQIPTMGPGEEVYEGTLNLPDDGGKTQTEQLVLRILPVEAQMPRVQFDAPRARIMEYPMKTVSASADSLVAEARGQLGLDLHRAVDELHGTVTFYLKRRGVTATTSSIVLKRIAAPVPVARDLPPVRVDYLVPEQMNRYVGEYVVSSGMSIKVTRVEEQLYAQTTGQDPLPIYPMGNNRFFYKAIIGEISFDEGPDGKVTRMVLHQDRDTPGRKVS